MKQEASLLKRAGPCAAPGPRICEALDNYTSPLGMIRYLHLPFWDEKRERELRVRRINSRADTKFDHGPNTLNVICFAISTFHLSTVPTKAFHFAPNSTFSRFSEVILCEGM